MKFSKLQILIAASAGFLVLLGFFIYLMWLNSQPPVLAKSPEIDPLTKIPLSISLNPLREELQRLVKRPVNFQATANIVLFVRDVLLDEPYYIIIEAGETP